MTKEKFRTKYSPRNREQLIISDMPSCTNQQWADETNINYIMQHCTADSLEESLRVANSQLVFGEMVESNQQLNILYEHTKQKEEFNHLPADVRKAYNYDFKQFLTESTTQQGLEKLYNFGLLNYNPSKTSPAEDVPLNNTNLNDNLNTEIENL